MSLEFNQFSKNGLRSALSRLLGAGNTSLAIYLQDISYPSVEPSGLLAGYSVLYSGLTTSISGNSIILSGNMTLNSSKAGTISWFYLYNQSNSANALFSDSVGLSGSGSILTVNTMSVSSGTSITASFSLSLI